MIRLLGLDLSSAEHVVFILIPEVVIAVLGLVLDFDPTPVLTLATAILVPIATTLTRSASLPLRPRPTAGATTLLPVAGTGPLGSLLALLGPRPGPGALATALPRPGPSPVAPTIATAFTTVPIAVVLSSGVADVDVRTTPTSATQTSACKIDSH